MDGSGQEYTYNDYNHFKGNGGLGFGLQQDIDEAYSIIGTPLKDNGSGLIRIDYLTNHNVIFVDANGTVQSNQNIIDYLNSHNLEI